MDIIVEMKFGSHLYGTDPQNTDADIKGIFLPSEKEILLGKIPESHRFSTGNNLTHNNPCDIDVEFYSLHHFIKLACNGHPVVMDMLHAPEAMLMKSSDLWQIIQSQRQRFYTKNMIAFSGDAYGRCPESESGNETIDWDATFHAVRTAIQAKELLTTHTITFPLREAPFLTKVREGTLDYAADVAPVLESLFNEIEGLVANSRIPDTADTEFWNRFLCETLYRKRFQLSALS